MNLSMEANNECVYLRIDLLCLLILLFVPDVNSAASDIASVDFIDVCEVKLFSQSNTEPFGQLCSLCVKFQNPEKVIQKVPLAFLHEKKNGNNCNDYGGFNGMVVTNDANWTSNDSSVNCRLPAIEESAQQSAVEGLILTYEDTTVGVKLDEADFKLPTVFISFDTLQFLIEQGTFNSSSNSSISGNLFKDKSWKGAGIFLLAVIATVNVLCAVLLQKYDIKFEKKKRLFAAQLILNLEPDVDEASGENVTALNESSSHKDESANTVGNQDEETDANAMLNSYESANGGEVAIGEDNGNESAEENARHKRRQKSAKSSCGRLGSNKTVEMVSSVLSILFALLIVVTALVLIFLFHDVLWWVMVVLYIFFSALSFSSFGTRLFDRFTFSLQLQPLGSKLVFFARVVPGFLIGAALGLCWLFFIDKQWIWILWDVLSFSICIYVLSRSKMPSFKWLAVLSVVFLVYDAIAVYVTPLFTQSGKSIMEEAATGSAGAGAGGKGDPDPSQFLPMMFLAELSSLWNFNSPDSPCVQISFNILGMGDVIVPGLMIVHAGVFGLLQSKKPSAVYVFVAITAYALSFACVFVSLTVMQSAQPALVFMVPLCLSSILTTAALRKEFKQLMASTNGTELVRTTRSEPLPSGDRRRPEANFDKGEEGATRDSHHLQQQNDNDADELNV